MTALLLDIQPGDEVIIPSFTFVSSANAFVLFGAVPVFVDIRKDTLNIDENLIESAITEKTKAIVVVHYGGIACEMEKILEISSRYGVVVVEDNAHGLFGAYRGRPLGSFGAFATLSFHQTKNISCGEGGALVINDARYLERAEIIREKGTNRSQFFKGQVDKYTWVDVGSSYLMSDILASILSNLVDDADAIQARRRNLWERYDTAIKSWSVRNSVRTPVVPFDCAQSWHLYYLIFPSGSERDRCLVYLNSMGVGAAFHYLPLHSSPAGIRFSREGSHCPVTEDVSSRLLRLPLFGDMTISEQDYVIETLQCWSVQIS